MTRLARLATVYAGLLLVAGGIVAWGYYFHYRPMFPGPDKQAVVERFLRDPASPSEQLRKVALDGHEVVLAAYKALDAAILLVVILCAVGAAGFMSVAIGLRKAKSNATSAL
jgi:hypothetical protein